MRDLQPVLLFSGVMLVGLSAFMLAPLLTAVLLEEDVALAFGWGAAAAAFAGGAMAIIARGQIEALSVRAAFLLTVVTWLALAAFASVPFLVSDLGLTPAGAFFEAMSGLTTTGATVVTDLQDQPVAILLWRAILQWIGGIGIVVTGIAILPFLQVGGMQLFRLESSDASDKMLPRAGQIAGLIAAIYVTLTLTCAIVYRALGMPLFDAIAHAMTTIATGGFSTHDNSMAAFMHTGADVAAIVFMLSGSLPFGVYMLAMRGDWAGATRDAQTRAFLAFALFAVVLMTGYLMLRTDVGDPARLAAFNVVSILTGTGYATADYNLWGPFAVSMFFFLTFVGGCAGSTACGIKIFRFQVAFIALKAYLADMIRPHGVAPMRYNRRKLSDQAVYSVLSFFVLFLLTFTVLAIVLASMGLAPITALSAAATAVANVGPGLGPEVGPKGSFAGLPDAAHWLLAMGMLIGRLEVFTVLVLFTPSFWRD